MPDELAPAPLGEPVLALAPADAVQVLARWIGGAVTPSAAELLAAEPALRALSSAPAVRDAMVVLLDRAGLVGLASMWDLDPPATLPPRRIAARIARVRALGADDLAFSLCKQTQTLPGPREGTGLSAAARKDRQRREAVLAANLGVLERMSWSVARLVREAPPVWRALLPAGAGLVRDTPVDAPVQIAAAVPTPEAARANAAQILRSLRATPGDVVLGGAGTGALFAALVAAPARIPIGLGRTFLVHVVEPEPSRIRALLEVLDVRAALTDGWLRLHLGADAIPSLRRYLDKPWTRPEAHVVLDAAHVPAELPDAIHGVLAEAIARHRGRLDAARAQAESRAGELHARWSAAARGEGTLRFLLTSSRTTTFLRIAIASAAESLRTLGHDVEVLEEPDALSQVCPADLADAVTRTRADAVLAVDWVRATTHGVPRPVPFVTWELDWLQHSLDAITKGEVGEHDHLLMNNVEAAVDIGWARDHVHEHPTPVSAEVMAAVRRAPAPPRRVADLGYIANLHMPPERAKDQLRAAIGARSAEASVRIERAWEYLQGFAGKLPPTGRDLEAIFEGELEGESRETLRRVRWQFGHEVVGPFYRLGRLERLVDAGADLAIWGNGWHLHPRLGKLSRGPLAGPEALAKGLRSAAIQIQVLYGSALHPRLVDAAGLGTCVLVQRFPHDFVGRVRAATGTALAPCRPEGMYDEEWRFLVEALADHGARVGGDVDGARRARHGLDLAGTALDEVLGPALAERVALPDPPALAAAAAALLADREALAELAAQEQRAILDKHDPVECMRRSIARVAAIEVARSGPPVPSLERPTR